MSTNTFSKQFKFIITNSYYFFKGQPLNFNPTDITMFLGPNNTPVSSGDQEQTHTAPSVKGSSLFPLFLSISTVSGA